MIERGAEFLLAGLRRDARAPGPVRARPGRHRDELLRARAARRRRRQRGAEVALAGAALAASRGRPGASVADLLARLPMDPGVVEALRARIEISSAWQRDRPRPARRRPRRRDAAATAEPPGRRRQPALAVAMAAQLGGRVQLGRRCSACAGPRPASCSGTPAASSPPTRGPGRTAAGAARAARRPAAARAVAHRAGPCGVRAGREAARTTGRTRTDERGDVGPGPLLVLDRDGSGRCRGPGAALLRRLARGADRARGRPRTAALAAGGRRASARTSRSLPDRLC